MMNEGAVMGRTIETLRNSEDTDLGLVVTQIEDRSIEKEQNLEPVTEGFQLQYEHPNGWSKRIIRRLSQSRAGGFMCQHY